MLHTDFHTHTTFCDGKSTPREMVEAAYRMGMTDFGVSGHADFSMFEPGFGMDDEKLRQYTEELQELREEYRGKLIAIMQSPLPMLMICSNISLPEVVCTKRVLSKIILRL